jgi:hypothetical protein
MPGLMSAGDPPSLRCAICGTAAAGPCARCRRMVCGDCCTLSSGGATTFAICTTCARRGGASLRPAWLGLLGWLALLILALAAVAAALMLLR